MSRDRFMRSFAFRWCIALVLHELLLQALARSSAVVVLCSPGTHSPVTSLGLAASFVILRVFVVLLWPRPWHRACAWFAGEYRWPQRR